MEIIERFSRSLGLSDNEDNKVVESNTQSETNTPPPAQNAPPIQSQPTQQTNQAASHKVIDFNSAARDNLMTNNINSTPMVKSKITTIRPKNFDDDAKVIADCLREDIPVIINLEETSPEHARRIIDFALGTTYAIEGDVQQVSEFVFVCTPKTVMVTFNKEEPKHQERDFSWLTRKI